MALLAANGAGKSTTLKAISGLLKHEDGEVTDRSIEFTGERIVMDDTAEKLRKNPDIKDFYLGMTNFWGRKSFRDISTISEKRDSLLNP